MEKKVGCFKAPLGSLGLNYVFVHNNNVYFIKTNSRATIIITESQNMVLQIHALAEENVMGKSNSIHQNKLEVLIFLIRFLENEKRKVILYSFQIEIE